MGHRTRSLRPGIVANGTGDDDLELDRFSFCFLTKWSRSDILSLSRITSTISKLSSAMGLGMCGGDTKFEDSITSSFFWESISSKCGRICAKHVTISSNKTSRLRLLSKSSILHNGHRFCDSKYSRMHREQNVWLQGAITGAFKNSLHIKHRCKRSKSDKAGNRVCCHSDASEICSLLLKVFM